MGATKDIRAAVRAELTFDPLIDAADITVRNMNGQVALNGTVPSYPQCLEAAAAARHVAGVRNVRNHLAVVLRAAELAVAELTGVRNVKDDIQISYDADPADVKWFVQDALERRALVEDDSDISVNTSDISVNTSGDTVTLDGHVRTCAEHDAVVGAAWMAGGVMQVRDYLDVTG